MSKSIKVGIFLVGGIAVFCLGLFLIGSRKQLFGHHFVAYVRFRNVDTLEPGSMVRVAGMKAGKVESVSVPKGPSSKFRLKLDIDQKFQPVVRRDSVATIQTEGMVGNKFVNIAIGSDSSPECAPGCTLTGKKRVSMGALMRQGKKLAKQLNSTISDLHQRADKAITNISNAAGHANGLIVAVKPNVVGMTKNGNAIMANIRHGHGAAGKLLANKKVAANVTQTIANAKQATANLKDTTHKADQMVAKVEKKDLPEVHATLANTKAATHRVNKAVGAILSKGKNNESTAVAIRNTVQQTQHATANLADDTDAIKHNFFFRGFFHRRGFFDLQTLTPAKYARSEFVKKPRVRVWIHAARLFESGAEGAQKLTGKGRAILDQSMSALVGYLPNNPIVVEGYAAKGMASKEYTVSRERAVAVRRYLVAHFHLKPKRVGVMPMGAHPPARTGKKQWNGVCLVLVVWKK